MNTLNRMYRWLIIGIGLLVLTGLISCQNPEISHQTDLPPIPDGLGRAIIELPVNVSPRTVTPDTTAIKKYRVILTPPSDASWKPVDKVYNAGETITEYIGPGEWAGHVYAFGTDTEHPIAQAELAFEIMAGETKHVPISLKWNSPETLRGNGILNTKLSFPGNMKADVTEVTLSVSRVNEASVINNINLEQGNNTFTLTAGVYIAKVTVKDRWQRTGFFTEAVWIIPGETSVYQINVTNEMQEGEYGSPILAITVDPLNPPTILSPVFEVERGSIVIYTLGGTAQYKNVRWYVDGELQPNNDSLSFSFSTAGHTTGKNEIMVIVTDENGLVFSSSTRLNILPGKDGFIVRSAAELQEALDKIATSTESEAVINISANFSTTPVSLDVRFAKKRITLAAYNGEKTITLASPGSLFNISDASLCIEKGLTLEGIGTNGNNSPLVKVVDGELTIKGTIKNNDVYVLKTQGGLAVAGIYAENSTITLDGGKIEDTNAEHWYPYEEYLGNVIAVGGIYARDSTVQLKGGAIIQRTKAVIGDDPSFAAGAIFLDDGSIASIHNATIQECGSNSHNFTSYSAGAIYVSEDSALTLGDGCLITQNITFVADLFNYGATVLVMGRLDMTGGRIEANELLYFHRYDVSVIHGSPGVYIAKNSILNKTGGVIAGKDSASPNHYYTDRELKGLIVLGAAAYFEAENNCIDISF